MADIKIRGIPDWVLDRQKHLAKIEGASLNERLRGLIEQDVQQVKRSFLKDVRRLQILSEQEYGTLPKGTVEAMLHEEREERP